VIGLSAARLPSVSSGAGGTTITVGLRVISTTTAMARPSVASAPASAAHLSHGAPPRASPGPEMIGEAAAGVGIERTGTPPKVSMF